MEDEKILAIVAAPFLLNALVRENNGLNSVQRMSLFELFKDRDIFLILKYYVLTLFMPITKIWADLCIF